MARSALLGGQAEEALAPCQSVLERYPKHMEASCLLAEARRELRQLPEAADLFERVLAADPESLIGHWGMSTILEEAGDLDAALYELECAWDASPGHQAVREELIRLRAEVGAVAEPELAPIGLARVYARGFQWRRAIAELRPALAAQPDRLDARLLLAECLWRLSRDAEAADVAAEVLVEAPDCLKANLIRGYARLGQGARGVDEGRKLLVRALSLDPECALAPSLFPDQPLPSPLVATEVDLQADPPTLLMQEPAAPPVRGPAPLEPADRAEAAALAPPAGRPVAEELIGATEAAPGAAARARRSTAGRSETRSRLASRVEAPAAAPVAPAPADPAPSVAAEAAEVPVAAARPAGADAAPPPIADEPFDGLQEFADRAAPPPVVRRISPAAREAIRPAARTPEPAAAAPTPEPPPASIPEPPPAPVPEPLPVPTPIVEEMAAPETEAEPETVPTWLAKPVADGASAEGQVHGLDPALYAEWADLLGESVELDVDAATRLEEALAEATGGQATSGAWREVVLARNAALESIDEAPPVDDRAAGPSAGAADRSVEPAAPAASEGPQPSLEEQLSALATLAAMGQIEEVAEAYRSLLRARAEAAQPAIEALSLLVVDHPDSAALHRALGDAYMRAGRFQKAIEAYNRAVASQPTAVAAA